MCKNQALTLKQRQFAEDNHNLVYSFLNFKHLSYDEHYDIVIFGYLRAVKRYFEYPELQKYRFSTIAYSAMKSDLSNYYRKLYKRKQQAVIISFDALEFNDGISVIDVTVEDTIVDMISYEQLLQQISSLLSEEQFSILQMKADGYSEREIAKQYEIPVYSVQDILSTVREKLSPSLV
jgi:RNA polymerase sigma factor (sigma-70 family)